ncbi:MAG: 3-hydroxyacyl-CoA dehydrogenase family protein [Ginsengibacter sp.]
MKIFIAANEDQKKELKTFNTDRNNKLAIKNRHPENEDHKDYDVFFIFLDSPGRLDFGNFSGKPVFVNKAIETLSQLNAPTNVHRINGWPGFLKNELWEIVSNNPESVKNIFQSLNREITFVKDEPGFVSTRVISMIINEAFFALGENISTIEEIDAAMKLGTNYPNGPFEWAEEIGIKNIYCLLKKLSENEIRYAPASTLEKLFLEEPGNF